MLSTSDSSYAPRSPHLSCLILYVYSALVPVQFPSPCLYDIVRLTYHNVKHGVS